MLGTQAPLPLQTRIVTTDELVASHEGVVSHT